MKNALYGAIAGDCCGTHYEFKGTKDYNKVQLVKSVNDFSDDTVCTIGVASAILKYGNPTVEQFGQCILEWCKKYPNRGYGGKFRKWIGNPVPYGSFGNGSAMRVSPCGLYAKSEAQAVQLAINSAMCSHNHSDGVIGAIVTTLAVYYAKNDKKNATTRIESLLDSFYPDYWYKTLDDIRPDYHFDSTCKGSVPVSLICFLSSTSYENCLKLAISMGGDADTMAAIAGGIAYAYYGDMQKVVFDNISNLLPGEMLKVVRDFDKLINE